MNFKNKLKEFKPGVDSELRNVETKLLEKISIQEPHINLTEQQKILFFKEKIQEQKELQDNLIKQEHLKSIEILEREVQFFKIMRDQKKQKN